jgi:hypothetical protein
MRGQNRRETLRRGAVLLGAAAIGGEPSALGQPGPPKMRVHVLHDQQGNIVSMAIPSGPYADRMGLIALDGQHAASYVDVDYVPEQQRHDYMRKMTVGMHVRPHGDGSAHFEERRPDVPNPYLTRPPAFREVEITPEHLRAIQDPRRGR